MEPDACGTDPSARARFLIRKCMGRFLLGTHKKVAVQEHMSSLYAPGCINEGGSTAVKVTSSLR